MVGEIEDHIMGSVLALSSGWHVHVVVHEKVTLIQTNPRILLVSSSAAQIQVPREEFSVQAGGACTESRLTVSIQCQCRVERRIARAAHTVAGVGHCLPCSWERV